MTNDATDKYPAGAFILAMVLMTAAMLGVAGIGWGLEKLYSLYVFGPTVTVQAKDMSSTPENSYLTCTDEINTTGTLKPNQLDFIIKSGENVKFSDPKHTRWLVTLDGVDKTDSFHLEMGTKRKEAKIVPDIYMIPGKWKICATATSPTGRYRSPYFPIQTENAS